MYFQEIIQQVAKTIGFTTFANKELLWRQWRGPSTHAVAAKATFFFEIVVKALVLATFVLPNLANAIKPNAFSIVVLPE